MHYVIIFMYFTTQMQY